MARKTAHRPITSKQIRDLLDVDAKSVPVLNWFRGEIHGFYVYHRYGMSRDWTPALSDILVTKKFIKDRALGIAEPHDFVDSPPVLRCSVHGLPDPVKLVSLIRWLINKGRQAEEQHVLHQLAQIGGTQMYTECLTVRVPRTHDPYVNYVEMIVLSEEPPF